MTNAKMTSMVSVSTARHPQPGKPNAQLRALSPKPTTEKVFDFGALRAGDVIWFSGYWVKLSETRVEENGMSMVRGTWIADNSSEEPGDMFAFKTGTVSEWPVTRRLPEGR